MILFIITVFGTVFGSFLFSILEAVILSVSPTFIEVEAQNGKPYARKLQALIKDIDRPLAAILTMNTITNTLGSFAIGILAMNLWGDIYVGIISVALAMVILIFCEIFPKTIGATHWRGLAPFAGYIIPFLAIVAYPIVKFSEIISLIVGVGQKHKFTREEMIVSAEIGASHGTIKKKESAIIKNLLMLDNMFAHDIMTPRSVMMTLQWDKLISDAYRENPTLRYSRIPVYSKDLDTIEGFIHRYKILEAVSRDKDNVPIKDLILPIHSVPETITVSAVLDQLIHRNEHIFVVVNDYGSTVGLVTLEDAIETLLGVEIVDEFDTVVDLRQYALEQWKKRKRERVYLNV